MADDGAAAASASMVEDGAAAAADAASAPEESRFSALETRLTELVNVIKSLEKIVSSQASAGPAHLGASPEPMSGASPEVAPAKLPCPQPGETDIESGLPVIGPTFGFCGRLCRGDLNCPLNALCCPLVTVWNGFQIYMLPCFCMYACGCLEAVLFGLFRKLCVRRLRPAPVERPAHFRTRGSGHAPARSYHQAGSQTTKNVLPINDTTPSHHQASDYRTLLQTKTTTMTPKTTLQAKPNPDQIQSTPNRSSTPSMLLPKTQ